MGWCRFSVPDMHAAGVYWAAGFYKQPGVVGAVRDTRKHPAFAL